MTAPPTRLTTVLPAHDHLHLYDFAALAGAFTRAGLTEVHRAAPQESACA